MCRQPEEISRELTPSFSFRGADLASRYLLTHFPPPTFGRDGLQGKHHPLCFSSPQVPVRFPWISLESIDPSQIRGNPTEPNWHLILVIFQTPDHCILPSYLVTTMMRYCIIMQGRDQDHTDDNDDDRLCKRSSRDDPEEDLAPLGER